MTQENFYCPVSPGEMIDKITILEIKTEKILDSKQLANVEYELRLLLEKYVEKVRENDELKSLREELKRVNLVLWSIEDEIRECEERRDFGPRFVELARSVYLNNDQRAALKYRVNLLLGSRLVEEKSYKGVTGR